LLEPSFLFGAYPPKELRQKFLLAQESVAEELTEEILPEGMESIRLPGHFFDMVGFRTDDVVFLADCLSSKETIDKYGISFIYDIGAYLETLENVKNMKAKLFIPSHAEPTQNIVNLAQYNIDKVNEIADKICELCKDGIGFEELLKLIFDAYGLTLSFQQYALVGSTVRSYLSYLKDGGRLTAHFDDNKLVWERV
jgi:glyoxylase-like metal-dependent hydrolase (beta-lactamase superfamily II)